MPFGVGGFDLAPALVSTLIVAARLPGELPLQSRRYPVAAHVCDGPLDYWRALNRHWACKLTLVNVEHDMECSDALVDDLLACPRLLCTHAYRMHIPHTYYAHGWPSRHPKWRERGVGVAWLAGGEAWAGHSGIGFCKVTSSARIGPLAEAAWPGVEMSVNAAVGGPWHVHWPAVEHYHKEP